MTDELLFALLSMDAYHREGAGLQLTNETAPSIGSATLGRFDAEGSFFGQTYTIAASGPGTPAPVTVLAFRGSDSGWDRASALNLAVGGVTGSPQAASAGRFYSDMTNAGANSNVILTGHSLGGALAGMLAGMHGASLGKTWLQTN